MSNFSIHNPTISLPTLMLERSAGLVRVLRPDRRRGHLRCVHTDADRTDARGMGNLPQRRSHARSLGNHRPAPQRANLPTAEREIRGTIHLRTLARVILARVLPAVEAQIAAAAAQLTN